jgi:hypothetical protein
VRPDKRLLKHLLRLLGPALLVLVILKMPDRGAVLRALAACSPLPIVGALALNFVANELKVIRWNVLLSTRGIRYPRARARLAFYASLYVGMLTPGRVGDVLRIQYLRHEADVPYAEGLASIVMDRLCDIYVLLGFVVFAILRYGQALVGDVARLTWIVVAATGLSPLLFLIPGVADRFAGLLYERMAKDKAAGGFTRFLAALRANVGRSLLVTVPLTAGAFLINYVQGYLIAHALHLDIGFVDVMCLLAIASLLGLIPISVSGVGVREALFSLVMPTLGYSAEAGVSYGLLVFGVIYLALVLVGFIAWQIAPPPTAQIDKTEPVK